MLKERISAELLKLLLAELQEVSLESLGLKVNHKKNSWHIKMYYQKVANKDNRDVHYWAGPFVELRVSCNRTGCGKRQWIEKALCKKLQRLGDQALTGVLLFIGTRTLLKQVRKMLNTTCDTQKTSMKEAEQATRENLLSKFCGPMSFTPVPFT